MLSYLPDSLTNPYKNDIGPGFQTYDGYDVLTIRKIMRNFTWSPIVWRDGHRLKANFLSARYLAFDFENEDVTIADTINSHCDMWHILGTTRSHQQQKGDQHPIDRFRLLLRFDRVITDLAEYEYNVRFHVKRLGSDLSRCDGASMFFKCTDIVSCNVGDGMMDEEVRQIEHSVAEKTQSHIKRAEFHNSYGRMSSFCARWLMNEIPVGSRSVYCFRLGKELCRAGLEYDDSVRRILASPTYRDKALDSKLLNKIRKQVEDGYKAVYEESVGKK